MARTDVTVANQLLINAVWEFLGLGPLYNRVRIERRLNSDTTPQALQNFNGRFPGESAFAWSERESGDYHDAH